LNRNPSIFNASIFNSPHYDGSPPSSIGNSNSIGSGSGIAAGAAAGARRTATGRDARRAVLLRDRFAAFRFGAAFLRRGAVFFLRDGFDFLFPALLFVFFFFLAMDASR
jgi:hypothetical protein